MNLIDALLPSLIIKVLRCTGVWFSPKNYRVPYLIYRWTIVTMEYTFLTCNLVHMGIVWGDLDEVSEASYLIFTEATLCFKIIIFVMHHGKLRRTLDFMMSVNFATETPVHKKILSVHAKKMCKLYLFFMTCSVCNCIEWGIIPLLNKNGPRHFPIHIWMPVDSSKSSSYTLGYMYQMITICYGSTVFITIDFLTTFMIIFACAQLEISAAIIGEIKNVSPLSDLDQEDRIDLRKENNKLLNESIGRHQAALRFVKMVEDVFNLNVFFQLCGTVIIICIIGLRITIEPPSSFHFYSTLNYLATMMGQLYLYCWCGNELTARSQVLRDALYKCPWYEQDGKFRRTQWIAMELMKKPIIFRAGYYIPLSRPTFVAILRCSYSYFAVLNQARK